MIDGPFGATIPCEVEPSSTDDDEFEGILAHTVALWFPGMDMRKNLAIPVGKTYIRPDVVLLAPGTSKVFLVADAKRRKEIRSRDVHKIARYRALTGVEAVVIFHPRDARVGRRAPAEADRLGIALVPMPQP